MDRAPTGPLPACARLLHIGLPKTGTTALQYTAQERRADLLAAGVRYPGGGLNHREAVSSLMGRRWGWIGPGAVVPPLRHWERLRREIDADPGNRIWISHEFASESDDEQAARFVEELGERLHVVITLRPFAAMLVSSWQQYLKGGTSHPWERWLRAVLADPPNRKVTPSFHLRNDQSAVVRRWAAAAGRDAVTVVVVDKDDPDLLTDAFEALLDLPPGFLRGRERGGLQANRSLSAPEAELLRQVNVALKHPRIEWGDYERLLRDGGIARLLQARRPDPGEEPIRLPQWAADEANRRSRRFADEIAGSGVRVVGDLGLLARPAPGVPELPPAPATVDVAAAAAMTVGTLSAALGRGAFFSEPEPPPPPPPPTLRGFSTRELAGELAARTRRAAGRRLRGRRRRAARVHLRDQDS